MERWKLPEKTQDDKTQDARRKTQDAREEKALNCNHEIINEEKERKALNSKYEILNEEEEGEEEKAETLKAEMKRKMLYVRSYLGREDEMRTSQH